MKKVICCIIAISLVLCSGCGIRDYDERYQEMEFGFDGDARGAMEEYLSSVVVGDWVGAMRLRPEECWNDYNKNFIKDKYFEIAKWSTGWEIVDTIQGHGNMSQYEADVNKYLRQFDPNAKYVSVQGIQSFKVNFIREIDGHKDVQEESFIVYKSDERWYVMTEL